MGISVFGLPWGDPGEPPDATEGVQAQAEMMGTMRSEGPARRR
jgi:hypothetical protein